MKHLYQTVSIGPLVSGFAICLAYVLKSKRAHYAVASPKDWQPAISLWILIGERYVLLQERSDKSPLALSKERKCCLVAFQRKRNNLRFIWSLLRITLHLRSQCFLLVYSLYGQRSGENIKQKIGKDTLRIFLKLHRCIRTKRFIFQQSWHLMIAKPYMEQLAAQGNNWNDADGNEIRVFCIPFRCLMDLPEKEKCVNFKSQNSWSNK